MTVKLEPNCTGIVEKPVNKHRKRLTKDQWSAARVAFENPQRPTPIKELAIQLGCTQAAIYIRSKREGWHYPTTLKHPLALSLRSTAEQLVNNEAKSIASQVISETIPTISAYAYEKIKGWMDGTIKSAEQGREQFNTLVGNVGDAASLKELAISLDRFDSIVRRSFGLDDGAGSNRRLPSRGATFQPVLDAEVIEDKTPSK